MAVQLKVTLAPTSALWFRGTPSNSGPWPVGKRYIAVNISCYYWYEANKIVLRKCWWKKKTFSLSHFCVTQEDELHSEGIQKELFQVNPPLTECEPLIFHSYSYHSFILFHKIILHSSCEEYVWFFFLLLNLIVLLRISSLYNRACTQRHRIQRSPCIEQSIALVFVSCLSPEFVSP